MPNYGYRCQSCQREFEVLQRMADPPQADCPDCGGAGTRLFYATGILFKGSGFYKTDSRSTVAASPSAESPKPAGDGAGQAAKPAAAGKDAPAPQSAPKTTTSATPPATSSTSG
ncbi:MAG TPA: FmdB family zinc ribbon protein [Candidatus Dormibacteraeota bacterium]